VHTSVPHADAHLMFVLLTGNLLRSIAIHALTGSRVSRCNVVSNMSLADGETRQFYCRPGTVGSVIKITKQASDVNNLVLCEVEVHGTPGKISLSWTWFATGNWETVT